MKSQLLNQLISDYVTVLIISTLWINRIFNVITIEMVAKEGFAKRNNSLGLFHPTLRIRAGRK